MKDIEIVVFNDKSWVRFTEYQKVKEENEQLKMQIRKMRTAINSTYENESLQKNPTEIKELFLETCWNMKKLGVTKIKISKQLYEKLQEERKKNPYIDFDEVEITHCMGIKIEVEE